MKIKKLTIYAKMLILSSALIACQKKGLDKGKNVTVKLVESTIVPTPSVVPSEEITPSLVPTLEPTFVPTEEITPTLEPTLVPTEEITPTVIPVPTPSISELPEKIIKDLKDNAWTKGTANVREKCTSDSKKLDTLSKGHGVTVLENLDNGWSIIQYRDINNIDRVGYIYSELIGNSKPDVTTTPILEKRENWETYPGMLVNFDNGILTKGTPENLVEINKYININGFSCKDGVKGNKQAVLFLEAMLTDMKKDGILNISISATGCYRKYDLQEGYSENYDYGQVYKNPVRAQLATGSEHRTGLAFDLSANTKVYNWIKNHGADYGFIKRYDGTKSGETGIIEEIWHYTYVGQKLAKFLVANNLCLEEFYEQYVYNNSDIAKNEFPELYNYYLKYKNNNEYKKINDYNVIYNLKSDNSSLIYTLSDDKARELVRYIVDNKLDYNDYIRNNDIKIK